MQQFLVWCAVCFGLYAGLRAAYHVHLTRHPSKVLVSASSMCLSQACNVLGPMRAAVVWAHSLQGLLRMVMAWAPSVMQGGVCICCQEHMNAL